MNVMTQFNYIAETQIIENVAYMQASEVIAAVAE